MKSDAENVVPIDSKNMKKAVCIMAICFLVSNPSDPMQITVNI